MASQYELSMLDEVLETLTGSRMDPAEPDLIKTTRPDNGLKTKTKKSVTIGPETIIVSKTETTKSESDVIENKEPKSAIRSKSEGASCAQREELFSDVSAILDDIDWTLPDIDKINDEDNVFIPDFVSSPKNDVIINKGTNVIVTPKGNARLPNTRIKVPNGDVKQDDVMMENCDVVKVQPFISIGSGPRDSCRLSMLMRSDEDEMMNYILGIDKPRKRTPSPVGRIVNPAQKRLTPQTTPIVPRKTSPQTSTPNAQKDESWRDSLESTAFGSKIARFELWMKTGGPQKEDKSHDISECSTDTGCASSPSTTLGSPNGPDESLNDDVIIDMTSEETKQETDERKLSVSELTKSIEGAWPSSPRSPVFDPSSPRFKTSSTSSTSSTVSAHKISIKSTSSIEPPTSPPPLSTSLSTSSYKSPAPSSEPVTSSTSSVTSSRSSSSSVSSRTLTASSDTSSSATATSPPKAVTPSPATVTSPAKSVTSSVSSVTSSKSPPPVPLKSSAVKPRNFSPELKNYPGEKIFPTNTAVTRVALPGLSSSSSHRPPPPPPSSDCSPPTPSNSTMSSMSILLDGGNFRHIDSSSSTTPDTREGTLNPPTPSSLNSHTIGSPLNESPINEDVAMETADIVDMGKQFSSVTVVHHKDRSSVLGLDPNELTKSQEDLSKKHEEAVKARKAEQEAERRERERLEEILEMCHEYQRNEDISTTNEELTEVSTELESGSLDSRGSMSRKIIKTNGSLGYVSPNIPRTERFRFGSTASSEDDRDVRGELRDVRSDVRDVRDVREGPRSPQMMSPKVLRSPRMGVEGRSQFRWEDAMYPLFPGHNIQEVEVEKHLESLIDDKNSLLLHIAGVKQKIHEIESQQTEAMRELEMERALLEGEHNMELSELQTDQDRIAALKQKQWELIDLAALEREKARLQELERMEVEKKRLYDMELSLHDISERLDSCPTAEESTLVDEYTKLRDAVDNQRKLFEDLEFQQLEVETRYEQEREMVQGELWREQTELLDKYKFREEKLQDIDQQQHDMLKQAKQEIEELEIQRQRLLEDFRREKLKLATTEKRIKELTRLSAALKNNNNNDMVNESQSHSDCEGESAHNTSIRSTSSSVNEELLQKVKRDSLLKNPERQLSADLEKVESARQQMLDQQGPEMIEKQRERLDTLKKRVANEVRVQWEEQKRDLATKSNNSLESEDSSLASSSETPSDRETSMSSTDDPIIQLAEFEKLSSGEKIRILEQKVQLRDSEMKALQEERRKREEVELRLAEERARLEEERRSREEIIDQQVKLRATKTKQSRPMTRYLPMTGRDFDLKQHIESAGHTPDACDYIELSSNTCHGFLHKMGTKFRIWKKRWFVFDKQKRILAYYNDKNEKTDKARGIIYFQSIMDVYVDHLRTVKSPSPKLTFCVKTMDRTYFLVAPSAEAMRIWVDVLFTGAEGYSEYTSEPTPDTV